MDRYIDREGRERVRRAHKNDCFYHNKRETTKQDKAAEMSETPEIISISDFSHQPKKYKLVDKLSF